MLSLKKISFLLAIPLFAVVVLFPVSLYAAGGGNAPGAGGQDIPGAGGGDVPGARGENISPPLRLKNPIQYDSFPELIAAILHIIVLIMTPIAVLFLVYAGFLLVTARGSEAQLEKGKKAFMWAVVGIVVLLGAELLAAILRNTINQIVGS